MTTRHLMIVVAVVSTLAVTGRVWHERRAHYLQLAVMHSRLERRFAATILFGEPRPRNTVGRNEKDNLNEMITKYAELGYNDERSKGRTLPQFMLPPDLMQRAVDLARAEVRRAEEPLARRRHEENRLADYHAELRRKYERAARYPWLAVDPDRPEPR
jgi:hypothetical protein